MGAAPRMAASSRSRACAARTAVCWRPMIAVITVLVSSSPASGAAADARLTARDDRRDLDAHEHEEVARERVAVDVQVRLLDVVAQLGDSRRAASSAAAAQSGWGATVVTNGRLVSAMRSRPGGAPTSAANGRAAGGAQ